MLQSSLLQIIILITSLSHVYTDEYARFTRTQPTNRYVDPSEFRTSDGLILFDLDHKKMFVLNNDTEYTRFMLTQLLNFKMKIGPHYPLATLNLANAIVTPNFELHLDEAINPNVKKILLPRNRVPKKPFAVIRSQSISQYNAYLLRKFFARRKPEDIMGYHECVAENNTLPSECEYIVGHLIIEDDQFIIPKNMSYIKGIYGCLVITNTTLRAEDLRFLTRMQSDNQPCGTYFAGIRNNPHLCPIKELAMINDFEEHSFCKMKADEGKRAWIWYVLASLLGVELLTLVIIGVVAYFHYQYLVKYWTEAVVPQAVDFTEYLIDCYECEERASKKENLGLLNEKRTQSISDRHRHHEAYKYKDEDHKKKLERGLKQWRRIRKAAFILFFLSTTAITLFGTYAYVHVYVLQKT